jgi:hypothetical protein
MSKRIDLNIVVSKSGQIEIKVDGAAGSKCFELTEDIEKSLGDILSQEKTSDFYKENETTDIHQKI